MSWAMDKAYGRRGGHLIPGLAHDRPYRGQLVRVLNEAPFAQGQVVTVLEVMPGGRVRIAYGKVTDMVVPDRYLIGLTPAASASDGSTSEAAAASITPDRLRAAHRTVLARFVEAGENGLNDFELQDVTGRKQTSFGVRRGELVKAGLLVYTGRKRPSDTGSDSKVWAITDLGTAVHHDLGRPVAS